MAAGRQLTRVKNVSEIEGYPKIGTIDLFDSKQGYPRLDSRLNERGSLGLYSILTLMRVMIGDFPNTFDFRLPKRFVIDLKGIFPTVLAEPNCQQIAPRLFENVHRSLW